MNEQKQIGQLHAVVIQNLPELTPEQRQVLIGSPMMVQKFLLGLLALLKLVFTLAPTIERDMTGWKCLEPAPAEEGEFELVLFPGGEIDLGGEEMIKCGKEKGVNAGIRHLEAILRDQDKIPVEMRKLVLVSTEVWLDPGGVRGVWCLYWRSGRWVLNYSGLDRIFGVYCRLIGSRNQKSPRVLGT